MADSRLSKFHSKLREAGIEPPGAEVVPPLEPEAPPTVEPDVEPQGGDVLTTPQVKRFPSNPHRFRFQQGEMVNFYDEQGKTREGTIAAPPVGDNYTVVEPDGTQTEVLKSELFHSPMAMMDPAAMGAQEAPAEGPPSTTQ